MFIQVNIPSMENSCSSGLVVDFPKMAQIRTISLGHALYNPMLAWWWAATQGIG